MKKKGFFAEFKEFISRGSVMDMAVGIVVGTAFTAIVQSMVNDIIMPFIGWLISGISFVDLKLVLSPATATTAEAAIRYGAFIQYVINFLLIAFVIFLMVHTMNKMRRKRDAEQQAEEAAAPPAPDPNIVLLTEIRDLLQQQKSDNE